MLILLPPSEGKTAPRRGKPLDLASLSLPELEPARAEVLDALAAVSAQDDALEVLGVGASLADEVARNTRLREIPTAAAGSVYSGVLYDALSLTTMNAASRRRANRRLLVVSALYGALRMTDRIAPYRLSGSVTLPGLGPVAAHWRPVLGAALPGLVGTGCIVDCRSSTYVAAWPVPRDLADRWLMVTVPGASHMAKHTRGLVARVLCEAEADPRKAQGVADLVGAAFDGVDLTAPAKPGKPWTLSVPPQ